VVWIADRMEESSATVVVLASMVQVCLQHADHMHGGIQGSSNKTGRTGELEGVAH
jgi:hypothetical protein